MGRGRRHEVSDALEKRKQRKGRAERRKFKTQHQLLGKQDLQQFKVFRLENARRFRHSLESQFILRKYLIWKSIFKFYIKTPHPLHLITRAPEKNNKEKRKFFKLLAKTVWSRLTRQSHHINLHYTKRAKHRGYGVRKRKLGRVQINWNRNLDIPCI